MGQGHIRMRGMRDTTTASIRSITMESTKDGIGIKGGDEPNEGSKKRCIDLLLRLLGSIILKNFESFFDLAFQCLWRLHQLDKRIGIHLK